MKTPIYMDNHATTRVDPRVLDAMLPYFTETFGNAASRNHAFGWDAEAAVDRGREQVAALIGASPKEIVFTSGATESDNMAITGVARMYRDKGDHIITAVTEHKAVLDTGKALEREGFRVTYLPVDRHGQVSPDQVREAITDRTILVALMLANNEVGTVHPIARIGEVTREKGVLLFTDAAQAAGKVPIDVDAMNIDLLALSAHKLYGPKGVGALYVRRARPRVRVEAIIHGGGHERGMRSGTLNVPGIVGMGAACEIARVTLPEESGRILHLRERLYHRITRALPEVHLNGHPTERLPGNLNLSFAFVEGESLLMGLDDVAVSSGSACTSASLEPSYVLKAMGVGEDLAHTSIRFGIGRFNTLEEIDYVGDKIVRVVSRLREMSPLWEMHQEGINLNEVHWTGH